MDNNIKDVLQHFMLYGNLDSITAFGNGHINTTYVSVWHQNAAFVRYIHQRINKHVFKNPQTVMENIYRVTAHIARSLHRNTSLKNTVPERHVLTLVPAKDGRYFYCDCNGDYWRTYFFIENAVTYEIVENETIAYKAGAAVGTFQKQLIDYCGEPLHETIPDFHNMQKRYEQLDAAVTTDPAGRASCVRKELVFLSKNRMRGMCLTHGLANGTLPAGITHNDTKLNNILFDISTKEPLCLIDLDTVMPGTVLFDTGDLIRTAVNSAAEDEKDSSKVRFDTKLFWSLVNGYLSIASSFLTMTEKQLIAESGRAITQIMAVRFLTDYLNGDIYYKTQYPEHNLVRARTQIALIRSMDIQWKTITHMLKTAIADQKDCHNEKAL